MKTVDLSDLIEAQFKAGFRKLRFFPELEKEFQLYHGEHSISQRLLMLTIGAVLVALAPFIDGWLLNPPAEFVEQARRIQFGIMLPAIFLAAAFTADRRLRRFSDAMGTFALLVVVCGWSYQRYLGGLYGYDVPSILVGVILAGVFSLTGLMFWAVAPAGVLGLVVYASAEIWNKSLHQVDWYDVLGLFMLALVTGLAGYLREHGERTNWLRNKLLEQLSLRDSLTDLLNHRAFLQLYRQIVEVARREQRSVMIAAIDVDGFKPFNDKFGHPRGDECLVEVAKVFSSYSQKAVDLIGRVGGDEFALVWYDISEPTGLARLESIRSSVQSMQTAANAITVSIGATWLKPSCCVDPKEIFRRVDEALYEAKRQGRNRIATVEIA